MYYVYVLRSIVSKKRYTGQTSKDVLERLIEHNKGCNKWTRANKPFEVVYTEQYATRTEVIKREHFLKSGQGRKWLDRKLKK